MGALAWILLHSRTGKQDLMEWSRRRHELPGLRRRVAPTAAQTDGGQPIHGLAGAEAPRLAASMPRTSAFSIHTVAQRDTKRT